ncbi:hypothetical protein RUM43_001041 [Polyplax serrata]|uniref:Uncharacterized protein n=1 Tax=Polyplax serrata TaxID=468196 RepID=A0AAN8XP14_POLSC
MVRLKGRFDGGSRRKLTAKKDASQKDLDLPTPNLFTSFTERRPYRAASSHFFSNKISRACREEQEPGRERESENSEKIYGRWHGGKSKTRERRWNQQTEKSKVMNAMLFAARKLFLVLFI